MPDTNKGNELSQENTVLKLSRGENIGLIIRWLWPMGIAIAILARFPSYEPSAGMVYLIGSGAIAFCLYKIVTSIQNIKSEKIYMKLTTDSIHYHDENNVYVIPWTNITEFYVENNEITNSRSTRRRESLYIVTKDPKDKLQIEYYFGYDNSGLAYLLSRKMKDTLNLPSSYELVRTEELKNGKPLRTFIPNDDWTPKRPPFI